LTPFFLLSNRFIVLNYRSYLHAIKYYRKKLIWIIFHEYLQELSKKGFRWTRLKWFTSILVLLDPRFNTTIAQDIYRNQHDFSKSKLYEKLYLNFLQEKNFFAKEVLFYGGDWFANIGHTTHLSLIVRQERLNLVEKKPKILLYSHISKSGNLTLLNLYKKFYSVLTLESDKFFQINELLVVPFGHYKFKGVLNNYYENFNNIAFEERKLTQDNAQVISIDESSVCEGQNFLNQFGWKKSEPFVVLHVRFNPVDNLTSENNSKLEDYVSTINYLLQHGFWVFRIGDSNMPKAQIYHPQFIDLTSFEDNFFLRQTHIFLLSECEFAITTSSGPVSVPYEFGKPIVYTNAVAISRVPAFKGIVLPRRIFSKEKNRILEVEEIIFDEIGSLNHILPTNLIKIHNSPQEILSSVDYMVQTYKNNTHSFLRKTPLFGNLSSGMFVFEPNTGRLI
jgi:putative glycosyltransferase (TIGR04372 family)